jgi:hypothetical protein
MSRDCARPVDELQDLSWRTRELGTELRRKMFEKVLPQSAPRATSDHVQARKSNEPKHQERPLAHRRSNKTSDQ